MWNEIVLGNDNENESITLVYIMTFIFAGVVPFGIWYLFYPAIVAASRKQNHHQLISKQDSNDAETFGNSCFVEVPLKSRSSGKLSKDESEMHTLSLVIPAFNEEERLPIMLNETLNFLHKKGEEIVKILSSASLMSSSIEILIVDDGSNDSTSKVVMKYVETYFADNKKTPSASIHFRLIQLKTNQGKGAAVKIGMLQSNSHYLLMVDADGATDINDLLKCSHAMNGIQRDGQDHAIVIGSRAHLAKESAVQRTLVRSLLMYAFHFFVSALCSANIKDTQCGFKLFTRSSAHVLFSSLHLERWAFDIEIVSLAETLSIPMLEVGVKWQEIDGSKLDTSKLALLLASMGMLRDMICINLCYRLGIWSTPKLDKA